jgi:hypothetical protein
MGEYVNKKAAMAALENILKHEKAALNIRFAEAVNLCTLAVAALPAAPQAGGWGGVAENVRTGGWGGVATVPAAPMGVNRSAVGHFAEAAVDFVINLQDRGLTCAAGQSDDDDLDFSVTVYHTGKCIGNASLYEDGTWACYFGAHGKFIHASKIAWGNWPDGFDDFVAALTPQPAPTLEDALELPEVRALVDALKDAMSGLDYVRFHYGDLHGVGFDRVREAGDAALAKLKGGAISERE